MRFLWFTLGIILTEISLRSRIWDVTPSLQRFGSISGLRSKEDILVKRQTFRANPTIFVAFLIILCLVGIAIPNSFGASKRIAVLYFNDYSQFDSPTGCGCIPSIIGEIFSGKKRLWNLEAGFTSLLNRRLEATGVYEPIPQDEIVDAMKNLDFSRKDVRKKVEVRKSLADQLRADTLVVGSIRKFGQERARANASQSLRGEQQSRRGLNASFLAGVQVLAYVYTARIKLEMQFYGASGKDVAAPTVTANRRHQLGGAKFAQLEAIATEEGTELNYGLSPRAERKFRPIVRPGEVSSIEFGTPQYDQTLLGMVTNDVLLKVVKKLRDNVGPDFMLPSEVAEREKRSRESRDRLRSSSGPITGTIIHVDAEDPKNAYINVGSARGIKVQQRLGVYAKGEPLKDPNTGELLDFIPVKVGIVEVAEVQSDRVSRVNIIEGIGEVEKGHRVRESADTFSTKGK